MEFGPTMRKALRQEEPLGVFQKNWKTCKNYIESVKNILRRDGESQGSDDVQIDGAYQELTNGPNIHKWTRKHSIFALMGGFVVDTSGPNAPNYLPGSQTRMALTLNGLAYVANYDAGLLAIFPESAIRDKSKANALVKTITCVQTAWFCISCITRYSQGLSISLLEVNTAAHSICALALYLCFWWSKPLDVDEGIPLSDEFQPLGALLSAIQSDPSIRFRHEDEETTTRHPSQ